MIKKYLWTAVFIGLAIYALFYIFNSILVIIYPYQVSYPEGFLLNQVQLINQGLPIYRDISSYPFLVSNYPPAFPYVNALLAKAFGISFASGRIISFLSTLACGFIIFLMVRKKTGERNFALISALLFTASTYVYNISTQFRVDMLGLLFSMLGVWLVVRHSDKKHIYLSVACFVLALFTKQTFFAGPIAAGIYLFLKNRIRGLTFMVIILLIYTMIFLILNIITKGELYRHNVLYNANAFSLSFALKMFFSMFRVHAALIVISIYFAVNSIVRKDLKLETIYFVIAALTAISVGKIGSNINYFLELIAASCVLTGFFLFDSSKEKFRVSQWSMPAVLLLQLFLFMHVPFLTGKTPDPGAYAAQQTLSRLIQDTPGDILSEDAGLLVVNKRPVIYQPFEFTQLADQGLWDPTRLTRDLQDKKFKLLILGSDISGQYDRERFTPAMITVLQASYILDMAIDDWFIYRPR